MEVLEAMQPVLVETRVDLIEQPIPAADDAVLEGFRPSRPICADESCHTSEDLPRLREFMARYEDHFPALTVPVTGRALRS